MKHGEVRFLSCMYVLSLTLLALFAIHSLTESVIVSGNSESDALIILDAGHGGTDGGSSAADGTLESDINLEVTLKTDAILGLMGEQTLLVRDKDTDLSSDDAKTIAQKKISDIRNRVDLVNSYPNAILISIHQNTFPEEKYHGAQIFYSKIANSKSLAELLQNNLRSYVDPSNQRNAKEISADVYLMNHIQVPGVLVECGFLTNPEEAAKLKTAEYQKQLAVTIATTVSNYLSEENSGV